ncbi:MAG: permease, partial [Chloroflexi bacterium HGW-Chloroflexi-5]
MLLVLPPIFILMGLLDVWVKRETMIVWMGDKSGLKGMLLAFLLGSAAAGPLYAAFPITYTMAKKGVSITNILVFLGAWSTLKIPLLLFEFSNLGIKFTMIRLFFNVIAIAFLSWLVKALMTERDHRAFGESIVKNDALSA